MLNLRRNLFTRGLVQNWDNVPREVMEPLLFEIFKPLLYRAMTDLICSGWQFYFKGATGLDGLQRPCTTVFLWFHESSEMYWTLETGASSRSFLLCWFKVLVIVSHRSYNWLSNILANILDTLCPLTSFPRY